MALTIASDYAGSESGPIFSEVLAGNKTVEKDLVRIKANVKGGSTNIGIMDGTVTLQAYDCKPVKSGSLDYTERKLTLEKVMLYDEFCLDDLRNSFQADGKEAGAMNTNNPQFVTYLEEFLIKRMGNALHKNLWNGVTATTAAAVAGSGLAGGIKAKIAAMFTANPTSVDSFVADAIGYGLSSGNAPQYVVGTTLTAGNIVAEIAKVFAAIPADIALDEEAFSKITIFLPQSALLLVAAANNVVTDYKFPFEKVGNQYSYNGIKMEFVSLPANMMVAGLAGSEGNFVLATDLTADWNSIKIGMVTNAGDEMFYKGVTSYGIGVAVTNQVVIYG